MIDQHTQNARIGRDLYRNSIHSSIGKQRIHR
jgi:hypothetical protein